MRISILSDFHFGYAWYTELEDDSFQNAKEAINKALDSDLILLAGDIFDSRTPSTEIFSKALKTLAEPLLQKNKNAKLVETIGKKLEEISLRSLSGIPVIAIHGTHERRGRDQANAIQTLEDAGFLIHLHCNGLIFKKDDVKVAVQGMSGVPERYAKVVLDKWNHKPMSDCYNILMLHQSIEPYVYSPLEPPTLNLSNLPSGFDLIVNGHIHEKEQTKIGNTTFIIPGSTIVTQLKEEESKIPKGFYKLELPSGKIDFIEIERIRKFIYREIILNDRKTIADQIEQEIKSVLQNEFAKKPIIKLKIIGKKTDIIDKEIKNMEKRFSDQTILRFSKQLESEEIVKKHEFLKKLREEKISLEEMGMQILQDNLKTLHFKQQFDVEDMFRLLADGQVETAFEILTGEQKTLREIE